MERASDSNPLMSPRLWREATAYLNAAACAGHAGKHRAFFRTMYCIQQRNVEAATPPVTPSAKLSPHHTVPLRPLLTKSVTAAAVSALGEVVGSALRRPSPPPSLPMGAGAALVVKGRGGVTAAAATPGLLKRTAAFAFFGFVMNGPVFHWWYGALERASAR